jgi:hypothetical protein
MSPASCSTCPRPITRVEQPDHPDALYTTLELGLVPVPAVWLRHSEYVQISWVETCGLTSTRIVVHETLLFRPRGLQNSHFYDML